MKKTVGTRLRQLRESAGISQEQMCEYVHMKQSSINRYENGQSAPSFDVLMLYADHFDVSMDYIFGRTDKPQGKQYEYKPKITTEKAELKQFIDMCFDPSSPMNEKLKETLLEMLGEVSS